MDFFNYTPQGDIKELLDAVQAKKSCSVFGVEAGLRAPICSLLSQNIVYITSDYISATRVCKDFEAIGLNACIFDPLPDSFLYKKAQSAQPNINRMRAFYNVLSTGSCAIVCTADSLLCPCPAPKRFKENIFKIAAGDTLPPADFARRLAMAGYTRTEYVSECGQFSLHGEILDIFAPNHNMALRIDYFDDQIESVSYLSAEGKRQNSLSSAEICPMSNLLITDAEAQKIAKTLENKDLRAANPADQLALDAQKEEIVAKLLAGGASFALDPIVSHLQEDFCILDYFDACGKNFVYAIDEAKLVYDNMQAASKENSARIAGFEASGTLLANPKHACISSANILSALAKHVGVAFQKIINANKFFNPQFTVDIASRPVAKYIRDTAGLASSINLWLSNDFKVYLLASDKANMLAKNLSNFDVDLPVVANAKMGGSSCICTQNYSHGFILPKEKFVVLGTDDLFAKPSQNSALVAGRKDVFSVPKVGDYVVHSVHGIGVCEGVTQLAGNFGTKDYIVVKYAGGDKLYVPTTQMNLLDRFSGAEVPKKLSKIGGADFEKVKQKVKQSVKKLAIDLVQLYAKRQTSRGYAFSADNMVQKEFEKSFPYTETQDQLTSIKEIKADMQSPKVMDRLLCGDVGFGKTEVAMRAAFKAVLDGKQVAFLAPTTILSQQHYNTCLNRMQQFGVNVEVLNRFKTAKQSKDILARLAEGKIDILCSTHRMLSKDVVFADLGLIILDEEQKFGVNDKEKLKAAHPRADVLTLSATPIPRTLHMSLSGIRDISVISTPPSQRLPISTYVTEYSDSLVVDAIRREKSRGGQTFILYNKVESIYEYAAKIRQLLPELNILVAHGQLPSNLLEQVIYDFYTGKGDVLICTTIIENGIDIENANTLIVCDADRFGLSQLYQIRGRVGRGNRLAYAYFTYQYNKTLTAEAYKRLDAISEFTEFGSGFKLAMRDLEIRGSGNVLGAEQHGFLQKVGYDMYAKLLVAAVAEAKGEKVEEQIETQMKVSLDAYLPEDYISVAEQRMIAYKKIAEISSAAERDSLCAELEQKLGKLPKPAQNLLKIAYAKSLASKLKIVEILCTDMQIYLQLENKEQIMQSHSLTEAVYKYRNNCALDLGETAKIKLLPVGSAAQNFAFLTEFLEYALSVSNLEKK